MPDRPLSLRVVETVAEALDKEPIALPPIEETISAEALNTLFSSSALTGAYTLFPYAGVWVSATSDGAVEVNRAPPLATNYTAALEEVEIDSDEPHVVLATDEDTHAFDDEEFDDIHEIVTETDSPNEACEELVEYADAR